MPTIKEKLKAIKIKSVTLQYFGVSMQLGYEEKKKITSAHLRELYIFRNTLSGFYFLYQHKCEDLLSWEDGDEDSLVISLHQEAVKTYERLSGALLGSEYFMLLNPPQRDKIMESFDYVNNTQAYLDAHVDNDLDGNKVAPIIYGLLDLFEQIDEEIMKLQE